MPEPSWRILHDPPGEGAWNMAVDEAIAHAVGERRAPPTLRFYVWSRPTLSLGYSQRSDDGVDRAACERLGIDIVRRPTGGRAVLHLCELTYSAAVSTDGAWGGLTVAESFSEMGRALVAGLGRLGLRATIGNGEGERPSPSRSGACFQLRRLPAVLVSGRKLVGSAQRRWERALLQQGSILLEFDGAMHRAVFPAWPADPAEGIAWLGALLERVPDRSLVEAALMAGWGEATGAACVRGALLSEERREAETLARARYRNAAWTFQR